MPIAREHREAAGDSSICTFPCKKNLLRFVSARENTKTESNFERESRLLVKLVTSIMFLRFGTRQRDRLERIIARDPARVFVGRLKASRNLIPRCFSFQHVKMRYFSGILVFQLI